nr:hypothetical protein [Tanacetum cinerariifolium]
MSTPTFAKTHNLIAYLEKPTESDRFEQIVDFLNANPIKYALTLQALVDGKKVIVNEASIRCDLRLDDAEAKIKKLKKRVKKLKGKKKKRTHGPKRMFKIGFSARIVSFDEEGTTLVDDTQGRMNDQDMFGVNDIDGDEVVVDVLAGKKEEQSEKVAKKEVSTVDPVTTAGEVVTTADVEVSAALTTTTTTDDELTLAQTLIEIKAAKPKAITTAATTVTAVSTRPKEKGIIMQVPSKTPSPKTIVFSQQLPQAKDKGKGIMVEPEKPLKRKDQIALDEEVVRKLEAQMKAEIKEEERIAREKYEANIAVIEDWDDVLATIDADRQLAELKRENNYLLKKDLNF